jgi:hypothetical protein
VWYIFDLETFTGYTYDKIDDFLLQTREFGTLLPMDTYRTITALFTVSGGKPHRNRSPRGLSAEQFIVSVMCNALPFSGVNFHSKIAKLAKGI